MSKTYNLKENLKRVGLEDIFSDNANFSGMVKPGKKNVTKNLKVAGIGHKAVIEVTTFTDLNKLHVLKV